MGRPIKVALVLDRIAFGGMTVANLNLYTQLEKLGYDVRLVSDSSKSDNGTFLLKEKGYEASWPCRGARSLKQSCKRLLDALNGVDVVIFSETWICQYIASALPGYVVVLKSVHNTVECFVRRYGWNRRCIDAYVCVSPVAREISILKRIGGAIYVVPNGTDFVRSKKREQSKMVIARIAYVGRFFDFHKGTSILPKIAENLKAGGVASSWTLAGDGEKHEKQALIDEFDRLEVDFSVCKLDQKGVKDLLEKCDFIIIPSNFEAFGLVLIESMALGCIPICSTAPSFSWILGSHSESLQVRSDEAEGYAEIIKRLIRNTDERKFHQENLMLRQKEVFSPESVGLGYHKIIQNYLSQPVRTSAGKVLIPWAELVKDCWWGKFLHRAYMKLK